jgi:tungstate transport system permease protein
VNEIAQAFARALGLLAALDPEVLAIVALSLQVSGTALLMSTLVGVPLGAWLGLARRVPARALLATLVYTGMGLPPVVVGLVVYLLLSRSGPLGPLGWLFTPQAMILAQTVLALPLAVGLTASAVEAVDPELGVQLRALGATERQAAWAILREARPGVLVALVAAFGAIISEVGAVMLVGGNIAGRTRVLTTAIVLETRQGAFALALALGLILLALTFVSNLVVVQWQRYLTRQ